MSEEIKRRLLNVDVWAARCIVQLHNNARGTRLATRRRVEGEEGKRRKRDSVILGQRCYRLRERSRDTDAGR